MAEITHTKNERQYITIDPWTLKGQSKNIMNNYTHKCNNLDEMEQFFKTQSAKSHARRNRQLE